MIGKKRERGLNERLDRIGREAVRLSATNDVEAETVAASPFLYARIRARIEAERARREEGEGWFVLLGVVWRAVPAMALMAIFAVSLFWFASAGAPSSGVFGDEALLGANDAGIQRVVFADRRALSRDEVLATIINEDERETTR